MCALKKELHAIDVAAGFVGFVCMLGTVAYCTWVLAGLVYWGAP